jgi:hypothetical protein
MGIGRPDNPLNADADVIETLCQLDAERAAKDDRNAQLAEASALLRASSATGVAGLTQAVRGVRAHGYEADAEEPC